MIRSALFVPSDRLHLVDELDRRTAHEPIADDDGHMIDEAVVRAARRLIETVPFEEER